MADQTNISVKSEDPNNTATKTPEEIAAEQAAQAEAAKAAEEEAKAEAAKKAAAADEAAAKAAAEKAEKEKAEAAAAADAANKEEGVWDSICGHFEEHWDKYAIGAGGVLLGLGLGLLLGAKKAAEADTGSGDAQ